MGQLSIISGHSCVSRLQVHIFTTGHSCVSRLQVYIFTTGHSSVSRLQVYEGHVSVRIRFICVWNSPIYILSSCIYACFFVYISM